MRLKKEMRSVIAVRCYDYIFSGPSMKQSQQQAELEKLYYGDATDKSVISQLSLFLKGSDAYAEMFEPLSNNITDENTNTPMMQVKEIYTRPISDKLILGKQITHEMISKRFETSKTSDLLSGRTLHNIATEAVKNVRKATAYLKTVMKDGKYPSGKSREDMAEDVLDFGRPAGSIFCEILSITNFFSETLSSRWDCMY